MKKALAILLILAMALSLCACGSKMPISGEEFRARAEGLGMTVERNEIAVNSDDTLLDCYAGRSEDSRFVVRYYELVSEEQAKSDFQSSQVLDGAGSTSTIQASHYGFYSKKTGEQVLMLAYVENTLIIGAGDADEADALKDVFKALGYR